LPELGIASLAAKIDTGARTAALHVLDKRIVEDAEGAWVEFTLPPHKGAGPRRVRAPLVGERNIKNTGGSPERRLIVRTLLLIGRHRWSIDVSLADREKMRFDLILGRTAIRGHRILVDPGRSFLLGPPAPSAQSKAKERTAGKGAEHKDRRREP